MAVWTYNADKWNKVPWFNSQRGQLAFICCNGPSFKEVDASSLTGVGRVVIGINSTYPKLRPDYWMGMDTPDCYDAGLPHESFPKLWRGSYGEEPIQSFTTLKNAPSSYFLDVRNEEQMFPLVEDQNFLWRSNTLVVAVQFAMWLGCNPIYLVGCDLNTSKGDYADGDYLSDEQRDYNQRLYDQLNQWLELLRPSALKNGFSILSCSKDSRINDYLPYIFIENAIKTAEFGIAKGKQKSHVLTKA